ncbi:MAG: 1-(5-phosphoribosyl)-5-[(5-phosphoribosylamino)methylideneamino]imidazole-4-carboxamide isomerase [Planctomycetes bacterium]|nr:1-(5-phosphoribosyl)-5-[(5-phosphoribosylamino)methylideneamino]imidazole-4-carboxamide isomerase [Planctomycetota bacterium]
MIIIPAIDLKAGRCVRLVQGEKNRETVYSHTPAAVARKWQAAGAEIIHVVDLDGAFTGKPHNLDAVAAILEAVSIPVELGGGLRTDTDVDAVIELGIARAIIGTKAIDSPDWIGSLCKRHPGKIAAGIDARNGIVAVEGWVEDSGVKATDLAGKMAALGVCAIIFTDIARDGMLTGPNLTATQSLAASVSVPVIASGGVTSLDDIRHLRDIGISAAIIGKALYTGAIDLAQAIRLAKSEE